MQYCVKKQDPVVGHSPRSTRTVQSPFDIPVSTSTIFWFKPLSGQSSSGIKVVHIGSVFFPPSAIFILDTLNASGANLQWFFALQT